ncbi:hypothetical protein SAMN04487970_100223 [Paenibacillus tianmuensis]|uniref:Uncharacterized protein n=1 Tax=Paenibacillus tianmuensis TaxID=624147 RepID=A0A1G4PDF0_9BACL|nr:hypothetical protein [Paenibacillus tianmuensis]SCW30069.1 hypothetical protein SAMN04487970_100223 [Paenibacillus tianmuensis]
MTHRTVARGVGWGVLFVALLLTLAACKPKLLVALMVEKVEARGSGRHFAEKIKVLFRGFAK